MREQSLLAFVLIAAVACAAPAPAANAPSLPVTAILGGAADPGFARADATRTFAFPADHGSHPQYRNEWWYLTGNLATGTGRRFGYQFTVFRTALQPDAPARESHWATTQVFMGHLALGDFTAGNFHAFDRFARGALGLAGAQVSPLRVWVEDWDLRAEAGGPAAEASLPSTEATPAAGLSPLRLVAGEGDVAIDLQLIAARPIVLHGDAGLSRKGSALGNASYYYSVTRLITSGTVRAGGETFVVTGRSWLDREWGTSALEPGQVGWDWLSLQLSDGRDLMIYVMRRDDGSADAASAGTLVAADGTARHLARADIELQTLATWRSDDGIQYPAAWRLRVASAGIDLRIEPLLPDQELRLTFRYWEGAVRATGRSGGAEVEGEGFVELTGYTALDGSAGR